MSNPYKNGLVQKQMTLGKDSSIPLMADNLPKIVWYSTHHVTLMKSWLVQKQMALVKDKSNPLTVDSLLKTIWSSINHQLTNEDNDVTRLQALVDKKKVVITEAAIREEGGVEEEHVEADTDAQGDNTTSQGDVAQEPSIPSSTPPTPPPQQPQDLSSTSQGLCPLDPARGCRPLDSATRGDALEPP
nr:hypothetical protein [Tanacetum cinerariifolium]